MKTARRSDSFRRIAAIVAAIIALATVGATAGAFLQREPRVAAAVANGQPPVSPTRLAQQGLWIISNLHFNNIAYISDIQGTWLHRSGIPVASVAFEGSDIGPPGDVAFDKAGNLWAAFCWTRQARGLVVELTPAELQRLANHERTNPKVAIYFPGTYWLACPVGLTFDRLGNLWIANTEQPYFQSIVELPASSLGATTTTFTGLQIISRVFNNPVDVKFDPTGNLWVVDTGLPNSTSGGTIMQFTPEQLATGGDLIPNLILNLGSNAPQDISLDHAGNLWTVANPSGDIFNSQLRKYAASDLAGSGIITPTPAVTITGARIPHENLSVSLSCSDGLAFDAAGDLWVANTCTDSKFGLGSIVEFTPDQLTTSGNPIPSLFWNPNRANNNFYEPSLLTFGPQVR